MTYELQYSRFNACSILIEWPAIIDDLMLKNILSFKNSIENYYIKLKIEVINTYSSILIIYNSSIENVNDEILTLKTLFFKEEESEKDKSTIWEIPVCYDHEFGVDLESFSNGKRLLQRP